MSLTSTPPGVIDYITPLTPTTAPAVPLNPNDVPVPLPIMPSTFIPAFSGLVAGGTALNTLTASAADATAKRVVQGLDDSDDLASYQVIAGTNAQNSPTIVHPANYDAGTNAVVFKKVG
jgi:hypothetical protein